MTQTDLYRHYNSAGVLLYVGISKSTIARLQQHEVCAHWTDDISYIKIEKFATRELALIAEKDAIKAEKPLHNIIHNNFKNKIKTVVYYMNYCAYINGVPTIFFHSECDVEKYFKIPYEIDIDEIFQFIQGEYISVLPDEDFEDVIDSDPIDYYFKYDKSEPKILKFSIPNYYRDAKGVVDEFAILALKNVDGMIAGNVYIDGVEVVEIW